MRKLEDFVGDMFFPIREVLINAYGYKLSRSRFNGEYYDYIKVLLSNLEKTSDEIKVEQFEMMRDNLINAYENIPYFTSLFNYIDFSPYKMSEISEIEKIPFLDKDKVRQNYDLLINNKVSKRNSVVRYTSGTTGDKLRFVLPFSLAYPKNAAMIYRFYSMAGVRLGDKRVTIGGRRFTNKKPYWSYNLFENQLLMSAHHLNEKTADEYLDKINKFNPVFIQGHPNSILFLALVILRKGGRIFDSLRAIFTTGETLLEENREYIKNAFNVKVLQQYGSGENCFSAQETGDCCGYMLNYEHGYVEMIGDGEYKEVVATSFQNDIMPFVRYNIGDYVKPITGECSKKRYDYPYL
ncbi:MAG TPA: phenylacetate--CoA ligase family protein, partial [Campylobacterales bacterium]|nr:phenylacetate--CoA ligase family protein [Campylobacterales bacterium]